VDSAARILGLETVLDRKPAQLSGGQRQRVALGRAIVREPQVFLFDEPLSNLDAKLRVETRAELARLHRRLRTTVVYVTHDQEEAMTLGGRVAVLRDGLLQQAAPPMELYRRPANRFVAGFVGSPEMNFLPGDLLPGGAPRPGLVLGVRPHDVAIVARGAGDLEAWVDVVEPLGSELVLYLKLGADRSGPELRAVAPPEPLVEPETVVGVRFDPARLHWFDADGGTAITTAGR
jgi:multiple sugar transport system ATP-binding protein